MAGAREGVRQLNVRISEGEYRQLEAILMVEDTFGSATLRDLVREAIGMLVEQRRSDPQWQERRRQAIAMQRERLAALDAVGGDDV